VWCCYLERQDTKVLIQGAVTAPPCRLPIIRALKNEGFLKMAWERIRDGVTDLVEKDL
jgi:hypothetical protein